ncbi:MAG TPA: hypothetical protein HA362_08280 [Nanoarchaeota archaeon]|nr:hypothetical protein [Nanoarchaeota archaeon]
MLKTNKKGGEWIAWVLATALFVSLSVMLIIWAKGRTTEMTESTVAYIEGKEECKLVIISADKDGVPPECGTLSVKNRGTITIKKFIKRYDDADSGETEELLPDPETTIDLIIPAGTKKVELLPIIEAGKGQLAGCTAKRLVVQCE